MDLGGDGRRDGDVPRSCDHEPRFLLRTRLTGEDGTSSSSASLEVNCALAFFLRGAGGGDTLMMSLVVAVVMNRHNDHWRRSFFVIVYNDTTFFVCVICFVVAFVAFLCYLCFLATNLVIITIITSLLSSTSWIARHPRHPQRPRQAPGTLHFRHKRKIVFLHKFVVRCVLFLAEYRHHGRRKVLKNFSSAVFSSVAKLGIDTVSCAEFTNEDGAEEDDGGVAFSILWSRVSTPIIL